MFMPPFRNKGSGGAEGSGRGFSAGEWPVSGGVESASADAGCSYQARIINIYRSILIIK